MDRDVFIVVAGVICLALIAGLYYMLHLVEQRVLGFAAEAHGREQREIVNHNRLARLLQDLIDEVVVLTYTLKNERLARSRAVTTDRVVISEAAREALVAPPAPADDKHPAEATTKASPSAVETSPQDPDDAETRILERPRPAARVPPTRLSAQSTH